MRGEDKGRSSVTRAEVCTCVCLKGCVTALVAAEGRGECDGMVASIGGLSSHARGVIRVPEQKTVATLLVCVRCRPLTNEERALKTKRDILRIIDGKVVVVLDPDVSKDYLDVVQGRTKEKKYAFDVAFGIEAKNRDLYDATVAPLIPGLLQGYNATVFAYGATGSGKTYTMVGSKADKGLMVLSLQDIFRSIQADNEYKVSTHVRLNVNLTERTLLTHHRTDSRTNTSLSRTVCVNQHTEEADG